MGDGFACGGRNSLLDSNCDQADLDAADKLALLDSNSDHGTLASHKI